MGPNTLLCEVIDPMPALKRPIDAIKEVWMAKPIARCYQTLGRPARITLVYSDRDFFHR